MSCLQRLELALHCASDTLVVADIQSPPAIGHPKSQPPIATTSSSAPVALQVPLPSQCG
jgi:hypothetical protein